MWCGGRGDRGEKRELVEDAEMSGQRNANSVKRLAQKKRSKETLIDTLNDTIAV